MLNTTAFEHRLVRESASPEGRVSTGPDMLNTTAFGQCEQRRGAHLRDLRPAEVQLDDPPAALEVPAQRAHAEVAWRGPRREIRDGVQKAGVRGSQAVGE